MAKGKVTINEVICKGCGLCVSVCPKSVLALSTTKINPAGYNPAEMINEDCIACTSCAKMCPDCAIVVERLTKRGGIFNGKSFDERQRSSW